MSHFICCAFALELLLGIPLFASEKTLVFLGDSLTEGYGLEREQSYPSLLEAQFPEWKIINSGISGSTSASGPSRMKWILKSNPQWVVLALGANDGLQGRDPSDMKKNLQETIKIAQDAKVKVILVGIQVPPNYGQAYSTKFSKVFPSLAKIMKVPLYPFLLEGVVGNAKFNQPDGIHPNQEGYKIIAERFAKFLKVELGKAVRGK